MIIINRTIMTRESQRLHNVIEIKTANKYGKRINVCRLFLVCHVGERINDAAELCNETQRIF